MKKAKRTGGDDRQPRPERVFQEKSWKKVPARLYIRKELDVVLAETTKGRKLDLRLEQ